MHIRTWQEAREYIWKLYPTIRQEGLEKNHSMFIYVAEIQNLQLFNTRINR